MDRTNLCVWLGVGALWVGGCGHFVPAGARSVELGGRRVEVSQAELQQDLQRFTGSFADRVVQAAAPLAAPQSPPAIKEQALRRVLLYGASAFDIATGQTPEINLLDMIVFVTLVRESYQKYWQPEVFGERGAGVLQALKGSERDIWQLADKVMTKEQEQELREQIGAWRAQHPEQVRVESVRLTDFSKLAGAAARNRETRGMLASVKSATKAADEAILLGERALFLAQRMPFLMRLQARVGVHELVSDAQLPLAEGDALLGRAELLVREAKGLEPLLQDASELVRSMRGLSADALALGQALEPLHTSLEPLLTPRVQQGALTVTGVEQLVARSLELSESVRLTLREARGLTPADRQALQRVTTELESTLLRWLIYIGLLGAFLITVFWGGFYLVKRATR